MDKFQMRGARQVLSRSGEPDFLRRQIEVLEDAVSENPELAIDLSRALVETVCKTILEDRGFVIEKGWLNNTPSLFTNTLKAIHILPEQHTANEKAELGLQTTLKGLVDAVTGLCQLRNAAGMASHGRDIYTHPMDSLQAVFAAQTADNVVLFLYLAHKTYAIDATKGRLFYSENSDFNDYLDDIHEVCIIVGVPYAVSELLFYTDEKAYREALLEYRNSAFE